MILWYVSFCRPLNITNPLRNLGLECTGYLLESSTLPRESRVELTRFGIAHAGNATQFLASQRDAHHRKFDGEDLELATYSKVSNPFSPMFPQSTSFHLAPFLEKFGLGKCDSTTEAEDLLPSCRSGQLTAPLVLQDRKSVV